MTLKEAMIRLESLEEELLYVNGRVTSLALDLDALYEKLKNVLKKEGYP